MLFISLFKAFKLWEWPKEIYEHEKRQGAALPHSFQMASKARVGDDWKNHGACAGVLVRTRQKVAAPCCSDKSLLAATTGSCPTFIQSDPALWHFYCYCNLLPSVFQPSLKKPRIINSLCMQCVDHSSLQTRLAHIYFKSMGLFLWDHPDHSEHSTLKEPTNSPYTVYSLLMDTSIWRTSL